MAELVTFESFGGLGAIGGNMMGVTLGQKSFLIDCGIRISKESQYGVSFHVPDFTQNELAKYDKLFITHGHEDHIGAIPLFLKSHPKIEVFAPPFAYELIQAKCKSLEINLYKWEGPFKDDDFTIQLIRVNHSIPYTFGLLIQNKDTAIFYASDFKCDYSGVNEPAIELELLKSLTKKYPHKIALLDSTTIFNPARSINESEISSELQRIMSNSQGRIFVTTFASNIFRIRSILEFALKDQRPVFSLGRNFEKYIKIAQSYDLIPKTYNLYFDLNNHDELPTNAICLLSGCQGDFMGSLNAFSLNRINKINPSINDIVIFSSKTIPGNEINVNEVKNRIGRMGLTIYDSSNSKVHCSGHASQPDLEAVIDHLKPNLVIPIHGEFHFLTFHSNLFNNKTELIKSFFNGSRLVLNSDLSYQISTLKAPSEVPYDNFDNPISLDCLKLRKKMARSGVLIIRYDKVKDDFMFTQLGSLLSEHELKKLKQTLQKNKVTHQDLGNYSIKTAKRHLKNYRINIPEILFYN